MATILIVDDLSANRKLLVALLRCEGHRLVEAADGREALTAVRTKRPDLVITDVLMPVMDGYEFVRQLRLDPATSGIPVVFCTAHYGQREARALALSSGVSYVLTKPAEAEDVLQIVGRALSGAAQSIRPSDAPQLSTAFDREHLRLITDKLSEKSEDLRSANARLRALINIGLELASDRDPDRLLQNVCVAARDLFGATYVTLGILDRDDRTLQRFVVCGADCANWIETGDSPSGILGTVVAGRQTLRGENPGGDPATLQLPARHPEVQAYLAAPLASPTHVYGWICLVGNEGRAFNEDDEQLVIALSGQVGRIYENDILYEVAKKRAEELEHQILERERAESALRHGRDLTQRYLDTAEVILLAQDIEGRITLVNRYACSVLGWTADELIGRDWIDTCVPAQIRGALRKKFHTLLRGDLSIVDNPILTRAGEERLFEWRNTVLRDGETVIGTFSSGSDITERKRAEEEVHHRAQLSALGAAVGLSLTDTDSLPRALQHCAEALVTHLEAASARVWTLNERDGVLELQATAGRYTHRRRFARTDLARPVRDRADRAGSDAAPDQHRHRRSARERSGMGAAGRDGGVCRPSADCGWPCGRRHGALCPASALGPRHLGAGVGGRSPGARYRTPSERRGAADRGRTHAVCVESANVGIWEMDYATGVLRWSETIEAQYGLRPGTFGGTLEEAYDRIHPDDRGSVIETVSNAMKSGVDFSTQHRADLARRLRAVAERSGPHSPRPGRRARTRRRHFHGRHRTAQAGGAVSAGPEDGSHRPAGRRRGARLQQPADRDPGTLRAGAGRSRSGRLVPGGRSGDSDRGQVRRGAHAPAAGIQPQADYRADAARPEPRGGRHAGHARAPHRGRRDGPRAPLARAGARQGRSRPGGADRHEPRGQRAGRHAERRDPDDRNRQRRARRDLHDDASVL